jgi:glycosyltransferase involved in cell wall biosynthesis
VTDEAVPGVPDAGRSLSILKILEKNRFGTGSVQQMFQAAEGLAARGHRVTVLSRPGEEMQARCRAAGIELVELALRHEADLASAYRLGRILRERRVHVVHTHKGIAHSVALIASYIHRIPCFVVNRGVSFPLTVLTRSKYRSRRVHRVVTVCEAIREVVIRTGRLDPEKVVVVHAGTDLGRFDPATVDGSGVRRELGLDVGTFLVCQIGVRPWRGWKILVAAMAEVVRVNPAAHLLLVGCESEAARLEVMAEAARHGVAQHVTALGYRSDVPEISAALDVAVDLSTAGLGITGTLREAMAMGKPVVCSRAGGNPELVVDGVTGRLVEPGSAGAAAAAIIGVMGDPALASEWGEAGRRRVERGFSSASRVAKLERLYREVLAGRSGAGSEGRGPWPG